MGRLTRSEMEKVLTAARADPKPFIERSLKIRAKDRLVIPFLFNEPQRQIHAIRVALRAKRRPIRLIILKARQEGVSSQEGGYDFAFCASRPGSRSLVIAHERGQAQKLMMMRHLFLANLPSWMHLDADPLKNALTLHRWACADGEVALDSRMAVETASGKEVGRGDTLHRVHASELAFYPDAGRTLTGVLQAVPLEPDTEVVIESTANGIGDEFHRLWLSAERGESEFVPIFLPFFLMDEYRLDPPEDFKRNAEEQGLKAAFGLDNAQLYWRRRKIATDFGGDEEAFAQEFPTTSVEAFRVSGRPALPQKVLAEYRTAAAAETFRDGDLQKGVFVPKHLGVVRIFTPPEPGHEYLIGVDTSLGIRGGDYSAAAVIDRTTVGFAAEMLLWIDPRYLAHEIRRLGAFYNMAIVAIELNNHGLSTQTELIEHLRYPKPWRWRRYDNLTRIWTDKAGWETNWRTRPLLIDSMVFGLRQHLVGIRSLRMIDQLLRLDADTATAGDDDLAMAAMIAFHCHIHTPMANGRMPRTVEMVQDGAEPPPPLPPDLLSRIAWKGVDRLHAQPRNGGLSDASRELLGDLYYDDQTDPAPEIEY